MAPTSRLLALGVMVTLTACTEQGGVSGIVGGPVPGGTVTPGAAATTAPGGSTVPSEPTTAPVTAGAPPSLPSTTAGPGTTAPPGPLRLGGNDLGVTRVGAPFREAVAAVAVTLGRPTGDPAPDTSCVGAEDETTWEAFRLASSGGRVSGWVSTSKTLATPAGVTVGTTLGAVRQAYGSRLQLPPPAPDSGTIFIVAGAQLGGGLTGSTASDTVTSLSNGTCESP